MLLLMQFTFSWRKTNKLSLYQGLFKVFARTREGLCKFKFKLKLTTVVYITFLRRKEEKFKVYGKLMKTHGRGLSCIPVSHLLVPVQCSSFHRTLEGGWYMSLFLSVNLLHKSHCIQTTRSIWCNYHRSLRIYKFASANFDLRCSLITVVFKKKLKLPEIPFKNFLK